MRVSVQGCLILLLLIFSLSVPSIAIADLTGGTKTSVQNCKGASYDYGDPIATWASQKQAEGYIIAWANEGMNDGGNCWQGSGGACPATYPYYTGNKDQYGNPVCASENHCESPEVMIETQPGSGIFSCGLPPEEPEDCLEKGEFYNPRTQECVTECPSGRLDNQCLAEPETECDESSNDYQGTVGWGDNHRPVCGGDNQCQDNETYAFRENAEGSWSGQCISNDSNPPVCPKGFEGALIITDGGFACEGLNPDPDNPDDPNDTSDGDSDGDGEGDTTGITEQLQDIKKLLSGGNTERTNVKNKLDGLGQAIKDGTKSVTDAIENIPGGGGDGGDDGDGDDNPDPVTWEGEPIDTELTDPTDDYDQVMNDYQAKLNQIKGEVQAMFSTNLTGGGTVDDNIKSIHGVEVNFSLNRFLDGLNILGAIVLFCAAFISAGILFTSRG